ncbi:hypothetical protein FHR32_008324 [Streptosporangium album]|uniref:Uncharacterized protein n=1 Tax=Streptosporangium album TaxID=47479 RepID=A0A7W7S4U3_9ACTN|nr:hypothetical protein [Streptosporangium album]MBB4943923.1 hypothetical protein [Streptosporangium album]
MTFDFIAVTGDVVGGAGIGGGYGVFVGLGASTISRIFSQTFLKTTSAEDLSENEL